MIARSKLCPLLSKSMGYLRSDLPHDVITLGRCNRAPVALNMLFKRENTGKLNIEVCAQSWARKVDKSVVLDQAPYKPRSMLWVCWYCFLSGFLIAWNFDRIYGHPCENFCHCWLWVLCFPGLPDVQPTGSNTKRVFCLLKTIKRPKTIAPLTSISMKKAIPSLIGSPGAAD